MQKIRNARTVETVRKLCFGDAVGVGVPDDPDTKNKHINKPTSNTAITLIALIITIIVLLILAGVTLNMVMGENGIFGKANIAKENTNLNSAQETLNLKITTCQMNVYSTEKRMPTLQELANELDEDNEIEYVKVKSGKLASLSKIEIGNATSIFTKLNDYPYEFEINNNLQLASIDGKEIASKDNNSTLISDFDIQITDITGSSATITLSNPSSNILNYVVYLNGKYKCISENNVININGMEHSKEYSIAVVAIDKEYNSKKSVTTFKTADVVDLYINGEEKIAFTGSCGYATTFEKKNNGLFLNCYDPYSAATSGTAFTSEKFSVDNMKKITVKYKELSSNNEYFDYYFRVCNASNNQVLKTEKFNGKFNNSEEKDLSIDVSDLSGEIFIIIGIFSAPLEYVDAQNWGAANGYTGQSTALITEIYWE